MKLKYPTLKLITPQNDIIDTFLQFSEESHYSKIFNKIFKRPKTFRIYLYHHIESAQSIGEFKHESK